eukprot:3263395-Pleurochrysis_carterae.AAC.2
MSRVSIHEACVYQNQTPGANKMYSFGKETSKQPTSNTHKSLDRIYSNQTNRQNNKLRAYTNAVKYQCMDALKH